VPVWTLWNKEKSLSLPGNQTLAVKHVRSGADKTFDFSYFLPSYLQHNQKNFSWMG
jgi:hypothetical protein